MLTEIFRKCSPELEGVIIECIVQGKEARVKNAELRHPVLHNRNVWTASPVLDVLILKIWG